jgi:hypothetical protein
MPDSLIAEASAAELATRMGATAVVVVAVALAIGRFGPTIGGALAGLPIVLGPGFFFLIERASPAFVADAAAFSIYGLCATQVFLLAYISAAKYTRPALSFCAAVSAWLVAAAPLQLLAPDPLLGAILFVGLTWGARRLGIRLRTEASTGERKGRPGLLLLRGGLAGLLVALVTASASGIGPEWSGILLSFPIGLTVIAVTTHEQLGRGGAIMALHSALLGTASLGGFCATLSLTVRDVPAKGSFVMAVIVSIGITLSLIARSRVRVA